jgi:two-component SAPR family response regulator
LNSAVATDIGDFCRLYNSDVPECWRKAIELYRGILLLDSHYGWAAEYEGYYDARYYDLLDRLAAFYRDKGNPVMARYYEAKMAE